MEVEISMNAAHELEVGERAMKGSLGEIVRRTIEQIVKREPARKARIND